MKVLLVAEGRHELGDGEEPGALEILVRRLADGHDLKVVCRPVSDKSLHAFHGPGQGYYKRAVRWLLQAVRDGYDALVLVIDHDGHDDRVLEIDAAQDCRHSELPRALGVAVHTFDAWMLSDEVALTAVLGRRVTRQTNPETIKHPKERCTELRDTSDSGLGLAAMYAAVAAKADARVMEARCPRGFAPFAERARRLAETSASTSREAT